MNLFPWLYICLAYLAYVLIAILESMLIRRTAGDLKDLANRNSPRVLMAGAAANLIAMTVIPFLLVYLDKKPVTALGVLFRTKDVFASLIGLATTFLLAGGFLFLLKRSKGVDSIEIQQPVTTPAATFNMSLGLVALIPVILQEEVLNGGYMTLNLLPLGAAGIILVSTIIFVLIHFITNRADFFQVISWIVSGLVLVISYLLSGSIWVPIILHYATDTANVLVFNITGQFSFFKTTPAITEKQ